jgi:4-amino-4-deoxy-L-arabinose transferase-like glycosyltransferase
VTSDPRFQWIDPDDYMGSALALAGGGEAWQWSFDAVRHSVEGQHFALPPLYPAFLSFFALFPAFPFSAQVAQILLGTVSIALTFELGRLLHSSKAGLIAAAIHALWLPNIIAVWSTMQEALYVPLLLAGFVLAGGAANRSNGFWGLGFAGAMFGLAALTRSMPVYYMIPASILFLVLAANRKKALPQVAALLIGFALITVPYSIALSHHLGETTFIENHGGLRVVSRYGEDLTGDRPAGPAATANILLRAFVASPSEILSDWMTTARSLFHLNGGRLLQIYLTSKSYAGAVVWKAIAHLGVDWLLILSAVLAPLGLIFARSWRFSALIGLWIAINVFLTSLSGFGGARLRAPFEPHLMVLAGVVLAGRYESRRRGWLIAGAALSAVLAFALLPQVPGSLRARGGFGVDWSSLSRPKTTTVNGRAGFNTGAGGGAVVFDARLANATSTRAAATLEVKLNGEPVGETRIRQKRRRLKYESSQPSSNYIELRATDRRTGKPAELVVTLRRRPR